MVGVVQLVEHRIVVPGVEGSSPFAHPRRLQGRSSGFGPAALIQGCSQAVKARDFDSRIAGSIPAIPANRQNRFAPFRLPLGGSLRIRDPVPPLQIEASVSIWERKKDMGTM